MIDEEVSKLIESQYQRALQILTENKDKLTALAEQLLLTEVIFKEDLERIFGKRQWEVEELVEVEKSNPTPELTHSEDVNSLETEGIDTNEVESETAESSTENPDGEGTSERSTEEKED